MRTPSYDSGYFSPANGGYAEHPQLWEGCVVAIDPGLGNTGNTLWDQSGYHNHGTLVNGETSAWETDQHGTCLNLLGSTDYLSIPYSEMFASKRYSWSIWVKSTEAGSNRGLISRWQNVGGTYSWAVTWEGSTLIWYQAGLTNTLSGSVNCNDGKWHHLCGTYDKSNSRFYFDGVQSHAVANTGDYTASTQSIHIGNYALAAGIAQDWDGKWRSFGKWNRTLTPGEVLALASDPSVMYRSAPRRLAGAQEETEAPMALGRSFVSKQCFLTA